MTTEEMEAETLLPPKEPPCACSPPAPWFLRRFDGVWEDGFEQRTCRVCGLSLSMEINDDASK